MTKANGIRSSRAFSATQAGPRRLGALAAVVVAATLALAPPAWASFSSVPRDTWVPDGPVSAVVADGDHVFIGGTFDQVGPNTGPGVALDPSDGSVDTAFAKFNGPVTAAVADGGGGFYVAGTFDQVGGVSRVEVAHLLPGGAIDPAFVANVTGGPVNALALEGGRLYLGGDFSAVNGATETRLAAVDATTGAVDPSFTASADSDVFALAASPTELFASGAFTTVNGLSHPIVVKLDPATGAPDPSFLTTGLYETTSSGHALALSGSKLYVVSGYELGDVDSTRLTDLDTTTGALDPNLNLDISGYMVNAMAVSGTRLFVGGAFPHLGSSGPSYLVAVDTTTDAIDPSFTTSVNGTVDSLTVSGADLYLGGSFSTVAGLARSRLAAINASTGTVVPSFDPQPSGEVDALAADAAHVFAGGQFQIVGGLMRSNLAAIDASTGQADPGWSANTDGPVYALSAQGTQLYVGGAFTHVGGDSENKLASVSTADGTVSSSFHGDTGSTDDNVYSLLASPSELYVGGNFNSIGGLSRYRLAALDLSTGAADPGFRADADNTVDAIALGDGQLYVGGGFGTINGATGHPYLAALNPTTGAVFSGFSAGLNGSPSTLAATAGGVYAGGNISTPHNGAFELSATDGSLLPFDPGWDSSGNYEGVLAIAPAGNQVALGGYFTMDRSYLELADATAGTFDPSFNAGLNGQVDGLAATATDLYAGGGFTLSATGPQAHFAAFPAGAAAGAPIDQTSPTIGGTAQQDQLLHADPGTWSNSPTGYSYAWSRCDQDGFSCATISGATGSTYTPVAADVGFTLVVSVTASNGAGSSD
ncbi:MAG: hypothetical protein ACRDNS_02500, partial [Trebonia sp.]